MQVTHRTVMPAYLTDTSHQLAGQASGLSTAFKITGVCDSCAVFYGCMMRKQTRPDFHPALHLADLDLGSLLQLFGTFPAEETQCVQCRIFIIQGEHITIHLQDLQNKETPVSCH